MMTALRRTIYFPDARQPEYDRTLSALADLWEGRSPALATDVPLWARPLATIAGAGLLP